MIRLVISSALSLLCGLEGAAAAGEDVKYTRVSTVLYDQKDGKVFGTLPPGTPVTVTKKGSGRMKVRVEGWSEEYHELELFSDRDHRIQRMTMARIPDGVRTVKQKKEDTWGTTWMEVQVAGWIAKGDLTDEVKKVWKKAVALYEARCYDCHEFRPPELLTPSQWRGTLVIMAHRAALTPEEETLLRQYFQQHARRD